jgi:hypothetical protein
MAVQVLAEHGITRTGGLSGARITALLRDLDI